jgi:hypothetical protein
MHGVGHLPPAFELDRGAAGFGHDARGVAERLLARFLIAAKRHVDDDQRRRRAAHDRPAMRDHHVEGDRQGVVEPVQHHPDRVADQQEIDMRVEKPRDRRGVGGQPDDRGAALLQIADRPPPGLCLRAHDTPRCAPSRKRYRP